MPIHRYIEQDTAFEPETIEIMSDALERVCKALHIDGDMRDRQIVAERVIALARTGVRDAEILSARVIAETKAMRSV